MKKNHFNSKHTQGGGICKSLIVSALALFVGCSGFDEPTSRNPTPDPTETEISTLVTPEMAVEKLENFMQEFAPQTRSGKQRTIKSMHVLGGFGATRSSASAEEEPLVYLFNFEDEEGFSLISGDTRVDDIMAFAETGNLDPEVPVDNPGLAIFLSNADTYYRAMTGLPITDEDGNEFIYDLGEAEDSPAIGTRIIISDSTGTNGDTFTALPWETISGVWFRTPSVWSQRSFMNDYCLLPSGAEAPAGCAAIAVAQIMFYHGKNVMYNGHFFDWSVMHTAPYAWAGDSYTREAKDMVARLIYQLGRPENLNMKYAADGSSAYYTDVPRTFKNFGYTNGGSIKNFNSSELELATGPVYVRGDAKKTTTKKRVLGVVVSSTVSYSEGHGWVIDDIINQRQLARNDRTGETHVFARRTLYHCNWGWGQYWNGYYFDKAFNVDPGRVISTRAETTTEGISDYYQYNLRMITGIRP